MRMTIGALIGVIALTAASPDLALAQGKGKGRSDEHGKSGHVARAAKDKKDHLKTDGTVRRDGRSGQVQAVRNDNAGKGPKFCREGNGHPVYGREWCLDKGFGLGARNDRWSSTRWDRVTWRAPRQQTLSGINRVQLGNILGTGILNRIQSHSNTLGYRAPLTGRWVSNADGRSILLVNSGSLPIAELVDRNRDGIVDVVLLARR
jgi:hypothetical protein